jgi:hypothetical protein
MIVACAACEGSFDKQARGDLKNAALCEELTFAINPTYVTCRDEECEAQLRGFKRSSPSVRITMKAGGDGIHFTGESKHENGWYTWRYDSRKPMHDQPERD